ncbi:MAG: FkbM family methyltransferase [Verrucomicrobia bacterium]|nr:FkbM family methyltransferase [Verrucomicrobiota bacterium]
MKNLKMCLVQLLLIAGFSAGYCNDPYPARYEGLPIYEKSSGQHLEIIGKIIPSDPVIFEAGGHYGDDTVRFALHWPLATIISFEANPHAYEKFLETTSRFPNIHGYNLAVNTYNGVALLHVCHGSHGDNPVFEGASSLLEASKYMEKNYQGPKVRVPCVILDDWCKSNAVDHIDFMWLDLEGLELQTLISSPKVLGTVKVIYTETNFQSFRKGMTQYSDLKTFLEKSGFRLLAHWYAKDFQGNAIFVRNELYDKASR